MKIARPLHFGPRAGVPLPQWDRQAWLCVLIAAAVLLPRAYLISAAHNECIDTDYHLRHGLAVLLGTRSQILMGANDPPLGQMIMALPMAITGSIPSRPINRSHWPPGVSVPGERAPGEPPASPQRAEYERTIRNGVLYGHDWSPQALLLLIALWKSALFVPVMGVLFQWCRAVYGTRAAWLTQALLLCDPTLAAHIPIAALDALAVEGIVLACFFIWRYFEHPTFPSLTVAAVATAAAILLKHTAVITPVVFLLFAGYYWGLRPWREGATWDRWRARLRPRLNALATAALVGLLAMWALLLFDVSVPADQTYDTPLPRPTSAVGDVLDAAFHRRWPAGIYIGCFASGFLTNSGGQRALLFGQISRHGWLYYFPALMTLKVPMGIWLVLILATATLFRRGRKLHVGEMSILIPLLAWCVMLMTARMNTGFRHFLPAYVLLLMWAGRAAVDLGRAGLIAAWVGVVAAAAHVVTFTPDYLSYVNFPRRNVWMDMTDSNLDWGQGMKEINAWVARRPGGTRVNVLSRIGKAGYVGRWYLDHRVRFLERGQPVPEHGLLVISPVWVCGVYDEPGENAYEFLQHRRPIDVIGHSMPVYDLDSPTTQP